MKKISTFLMAAAIAFTFAACGGATQPTTDGDAPKTEEQAEEPQAGESTETAQANVIDQYVSLIEKYAELMEKGEMEEAAKLNQEITTLAQNADFLAEIQKPENVTKFQEAGKKLADAAAKIAQK